MTILGSTRLGTSLTGHGELVALAIEQAELDTSVDLVDDEVVERFIQCANHALPYFSVFMRFNFLKCISTTVLIKNNSFSRK